MRSRITLLLIAALALLLSAFAAAPAQAGEVHKPAKPGAVRMAALGNCGSHAWYSDRVCLISYGSGRVSYSVLHVHTGPDGHDYADGEAYGAPGTTVYFDVSRNGGSTWNGWIDQTTLGGSYWSGLYTSNTQYDGPGYWVRTCATAHDGVYVCTGWN